MHTFLISPSHYVGIIRYKYIQHHLKSLGLNFVFQLKHILSRNTLLDHDVLLYSATQQLSLYFSSLVNYLVRISNGLFGRPVSEQALIID